jgi:hypothetical protein
MTCYMVCQSPIYSYLKMPRHTKIKIGLWHKGAAKIISIFSFSP